MGWLDQVPRAGELFIGGLYSLRRRQAVQDAKISHVVSVLRWPVDQDLVAPFKHLQIEVDDDEDENLIEHFATTNKFIQDALDAGGSVFVHCAMGKSRSATIVIAHLMRRFHISPTEALEQVREGRGVCEPNEGFWEQLELYHSMQTPADVEAHATYQRWLYQKELEASRRIKQAPEAEKIRFEDEHARTGDRPGIDSYRDLKCRRCRRILANSLFLVEHVPKEVPGKASSPTVPPSTCAHYFLDPLSWMRPELEQGKMEGRLECPKCRTNVGKYAWQGMQCSCGDWVVPGISLAKGRIDEIKTRAPASTEEMGIRLPPGAAPGRASSSTEHL